MIRVCPRCSCESFRQFHLLAVEVDQCERCQGIWLDAGEYEKIVEGARHVPERSFDALPPTSDISEDSYQPLRVGCPSCIDGLLAANPIRFEFIKHVVITDRCPACSGVWFDSAELSLLLSFLRREDAVIARIARDEVERLGRERERIGAAAATDTIDEASVSRRGFWRALVGLSPDSKKTS